MTTDLKILSNRDDDLLNEIFSESHLTSLYFKKIGLSRATGKDGIRRGQYEKNIKEETQLIARKVHNKIYKFTNYKEKLVSKGAKKPPRQLSIPTIRDRLTLRGLCDLLTMLFSDAVTRPPHEYIKKIRGIVSTLSKDFCFLRMDIQDYYPSINHTILLDIVKKRVGNTAILELLKNAVETPTGARIAPNNKVGIGVPQGLSISNILSSIYLLELDKKYVGSYNYFRYVDDILVICPRVDALNIHRQIETDLEKLGLKSHPMGSSEKTKVASLSEGIEYLGFLIKNESLSVRKSSYDRMFTNLLKVFTSYRYAKSKERFLFRLNLKISGCIYEEKRCGWIFFFAQTENKSQLKYLDEFVQKLLVKFRLEELKGKVKTFTKAYHEIRYNGRNTNYIENFGGYTREQKIEVISTLTGKSQIEIDAWDAIYIDHMFQKLAQKEVSQLEKDILDVFY